MLTVLLLLAAPVDVPYTRMSSFFVRNDAPNGEYFVFSDRASFDKVLHPKATKRPVEMPDFGKVSVVAVVRRGNAPCGFRVVAVSQGPDGVLSVQYKATEGPKSAPGRTWANFLCISIERNNFKTVEFLENGKKVATKSWTP